MPSGAHVTAVSVRGFRSIPSQTVRMTNPMVLVGANGSGKSNFVDVFSILSEAAEQPLQAVFDRRGGISAVRHRTPARTNSSVGIAVSVSDLTTSSIEGVIPSARYAFEVREVGKLEVEIVREQCLIVLPNNRTIWFDREGETLGTNVEWLKSVRGSWFSPSSLAISVLGSIAPFSALRDVLVRMKVYSIDPEVLGGMQEVDSGITLRENGSNGASVLSEIQGRAPDAFRRIAEILLAVAPGVDEVRSSRHGRQMSFEFVQRWGNKSELLFDAFSMSKGTLRALGLLLAVFQRTTPFLITVEEPEASLHPGAVSSILDVLRYAAGTMHVVITTHSPEVLDAEWLNDDNIRFVSWSEGATTVSDLAQSSRNAIRQHLMGAGELLRSNALEPSILFSDTSDLELFSTLE